MTRQALMTISLLLPPSSSNKYPKHTLNRSAFFCNSGIVLIMSIFLFMKLSYKTAVGQAESTSIQAPARAIGKAQTS